MIYYFIKWDTEKAGPATHKLLGAELIRSAAEKFANNPSASNYLRLEYVTLVYQQIHKNGKTSDEARKIALEYMDSKYNPDGYFPLNTSEFAY